MKLVKSTYGYNCHIPMTTCVGKFVYGNFAFHVCYMIRDSVSIDCLDVTTREAPIGETRLTKTGSRKAKAMAK